MKTIIIPAVLLAFLVWTLAFIGIACSNMHRVETPSNVSIIQAYPRCDIPPPPHLAEMVAANEFTARWYLNQLQEWDRRVAVCLNKDK